MAKSGAVTHPFKDAVEKKVSLDSPASDPVLLEGDAGMKIVIGMKVMSEPTAALDAARKESK